MTEFKATDLVKLFNLEFIDCNTRLIDGADEPLYLPQDDDFDHHRLFFREDYFRSALHEIAHWCIAGEKRRLLVDFGYWYEPEGRTQSQQNEFEQVEVKPQAIEKLFCLACGHAFSVSADNIEAGIGASNHFEQQVMALAAQYQQDISLMPIRAQRFYHCLQGYYQS